MRNKIRPFKDLGGAVHKWLIEDNLCQRVLSTTNLILNAVDRLEGVEVKVKMVPQFLVWSIIPAVWLLARCLDRLHMLRAAPQLLWVQVPVLAQCMVPAALIFLGRHLEQTQVPPAVPPHRYLVIIPTYTQSFLICLIGIPTLGSEVESPGELCSPASRMRIENVDTYPCVSS